MENQELRTKIDGLKGTLVQVMDEGFDIAKSFLSLRLEEYLNRTTGGSSSSASSSKRSLNMDTESDSASDSSSRSSARRSPSMKTAKSRRN